MPKKINLVKLIKYDETRKQDILAASMYFNTMSSKTEYDTYFDRLVQAKSLMALYNDNLKENRAVVADRNYESKMDTWNKKKASGLSNCRRPSKAPLTGPVKDSEVVTWLGVRGELLSDTSERVAKNNITVGVIVRIANLCSDEIFEWLTTLLENAEPQDKATYNHVLVQRFMTHSCIWKESNAKDAKLRSVLDFCTCARVLSMLSSSVCMRINEQANDATYMQTHTPCKHTRAVALYQEVLDENVLLQGEGGDD